MFEFIKCLDCKKEIIFESSEFPLIGIIVVCNNCNSVFEVNYPKKLERKLLIKTFKRNYVLDDLFGRKVKINKLKNPKG